jgi:uncharacterized protein YecE (DUF72 family)
MAAGVGDFFVGTSGFASPAMRAAVPSTTSLAADLLAGYGRVFSAVELDSVFYRHPSEETVRSWRDATPESFRFSVRMPREITHVERLGLPDMPPQFITSLEALGPRLGAVLFTTPPTFGCDVDRFRDVLDRLPAGIRTAWEFRHASWMCPDILELLAQRASCPVIVESLETSSRTDLLPGGALADRYEFPFVYVRFRRESYTYADLVVWGDMLGDVLGEGRDVYAFFRQSPEAACYATALGELLAEAKAATFASPIMVQPGLPAFQ